MAKKTYTGEPDEEYLALARFIMGQTQEGSDSRDKEQVIALGEYVEGEGYWCGCSHPGEAEFCDDGQHPVLYQHHLRCVQCGGILQIG